MKQTRIKKFWTRIKYMYSNTQYLLENKNEKKKKVELEF